jgi:8-oxo-dGTP pyrophosphatase MutT (NUDIX family)
MILTTLRAEASDALTRYLAQYPEERTALAAFRAQLDSPEDCFVRSNMTGHVTTSAAILNPDLTKVLLIHHRALQLWCPPGGHWEAPDTLWDSARREAAEETGVTSITLHPWCVQVGAPFDLDTHTVPANPKKAEGAHMHHDFRYLAIAADEGQLAPQLEEVLDAKWVPIAELRGIPNRRLTTLAQKLDRLLAA